MHSSTFNSEELPVRNRAYQPWVIALVAGIVLFLAGIEAAARFVSKVTVQNVTTGAAPADAKSILAVMGSGAAKGHTVRLTADGPDEEQAIAVLHDLFASGLGEELEA